MKFRTGIRDVVVNLVSQGIWVVMVAGSAATLLFLFGTTDVHDLLGAQVRVPAVVILAAAVVALGAGVFIFVVTRKASVVRGRASATGSNLELLRARNKVRSSERVIRSTRFGSWPPAEVLHQRSAFRNELDSAILREGADVRRIWNVGSLDDLNRLREMLGRYEGNANHSIRTYFKLPYHALPELLVVDRHGASMSFPTMRTPRGLDWTARFKRADLMLVVRDYFDVLWDRAEKILDSGELTATGRQRLHEFEQQTRGSSASTSPSVRQE